MAIVLAEECELLSRAKTGRHRRLRFLPHFDDRGGAGIAASEETEGSTDPREVIDKQRTYTLLQQIRRREDRVSSSRGHSANQRHTIRWHWIDATSDRGHPVAVWSCRGSSSPYQPVVHWIAVWSCRGRPRRGVSSRWRRKYEAACIVVAEASAPDGVVRGCCLLWLVHTFLAASSY